MAGTGGELNRLATKTQSAPWLRAAVNARVGTWLSGWLCAVSGACASNTAFRRHRPRVGLSLWTIIGCLALVLLMATIDCKQGTARLALLKEVQALLIGIEVFLTGIVGVYCYCGTSAARPSGWPGRCAQLRVR